MGLIREIRFHDAQKLFDHVLEHHKHEFLDAVNATGVSNRVFRGVDDSTYENVPLAFRENHILNDYQQYADRYIKYSFKSGDYSRWHRHSEMRAVQHFLNHSDRIGAVTPFDLEFMHSALTEAMQIKSSGELDVDNTFEPDVFPRSHLTEAFALAQHYGVPTRLLDWTVSPFVALFFSCSFVWKNIQRSSVNEIRYSVENNKTCIAVYALDHSNIEHIEMKMIRPNRSRNPNLLAQRGVFILDRCADNFRMEEGKWPSMESRIRQYSGSWLGQPILVKYTLPASRALDLLKVLTNLDIYYETMFPSLESAAQAFKYRKIVMTET